MTVTVLDQELWRLLEPMTPNPLGRLAAVAELSAAGIPTSVFLAPVVPLVGEDDALEVLKAAAEVGVDAVMVQPLRLSAGVREWLLPRLDHRLPGVGREIANLYQGRETLAPQARRRLMAPIQARRDKLGLGRPVPPLCERHDQLALFGVAYDASEPNHPPA
jgi:DNA repair photolyase